MLVSDLVGVNAVPQVVTLGAVEELKHALRHKNGPSRAQRAQLRDLLQRYFIGEQDNRQALETILHSLGQTAGSPFIIYGPYGSGKTHLLAVLSLIAEFDSCRREFFTSHSRLARFEQEMAKKSVVVHASLEEFSGAEADLETIIYDAVESELGSDWHEMWTPLADISYFLTLFEEKVLPYYHEEWQRFCDKNAALANWERSRAENPRETGLSVKAFLEEIGLPLNYRRSRAEALSSLFRSSEENGATRIILLVDELSTFLAARDKRSLNRDAAFLQFLAQQTRNLPLWLVCTAQRSLEDVGDIDSHTLRQIKDRFRGRFTLSMSEIRKVIGEKIVEKKAAKKFRTEIEALYQGYENPAARLTFSASELAETYPVNPLALNSLEKLAANFLSSTRSLIGIVQRGVLEEDGLLAKPAENMLCLDRIFDLERDDLLALPEAREFRAVWHFWENNLNEIVEKPDRAKAWTILKTLLMVSMAGYRWSVSRLADALIGCEARALWSDREEVERILRRLWRRGAYIELIPAADAANNTYFIEATTDLSEGVRRRLLEALAAQEAYGERTNEWALETMEEEPLPLARFATGRAEAFEWQGTKRYASIVHKRASSLKEGELKQAAALLESPAGKEDVCLYILPPGTDDATAIEAWRQAGKELQGRFREALLLWVPAALNEAEAELLLEHAALKTLLADATLSSSQKGRDFKQHLQERYDRVRTECRNAVRRAYLRGRILDWQAADAGTPAIANAERWEELLAEVFSAPLEKVFEKFPSIAPRKKLVSRHYVNQIIEGFIRQGRLLRPQGALADALAAYLEPLGFVGRKGEEWRLDAGNDELVQDVLALVPESGTEPRPETVVSYDTLLASLRKSPWGLTPELAELALAALVKLGYLKGLDSFLNPTSVTHAALPLSGSMPFMMRPAPLAAREREWFRKLHEMLFGAAISFREPADQERAWDRLCEWRKAARRELPALEAALDGAMRALGQERLLWQQSLELLDAMSRLLENGAFDKPSVPGIEELRRATKKVFSQEKTAFDRLADFAALRRFARDQSAQMLQAYTYLSDKRFSLPTDGPAWARSRHFLETAAEGEVLIEKAGELVAVWQEVSHLYKTRYTAWHAHQHSASRFRAYLELKNSTLYRLGERLALAHLDGGEFSAVKQNLDEALSAYCPGRSLSMALETTPVCPDCGLKLNEQLPLTEKEALATGLKHAVEAMWERLFESDRAKLLHARLDTETSKILKEKVRDVLARKSRPFDGDLVEAISVEVAEWIARQQLLKVRTRRNITRLSDSLKGKSLTRRQTAEIFYGWLDEGGEPGENDLISFE